MDTFTENSDLTARCNEQLGQSNQIYLEVRTLYQSLPKDIGSNSEQIQGTMSTINSLFNKAKTVDDLTAELLSSCAPLSESTELLLINRDALLTELRGINRNIEKKAKNIRSLVQHEIKNMSTGRTALQGYGKAVVTRKKNIVNDTF